MNDAPGNPYSRMTERKELDRMAEATQTVEQMIKEEKERLIEREKYLAQLRESEGVPANTKKRWLIHASLKPKITQAIAVWLAFEHPVRMCLANNPHDTGLNVP